MIAICILYRLRAYNMKIPIYYQCITMHLPPPIRLILQNGAGWACVVIILFVQLLLPKTQVHFLLLKVHVCLFPFCGFSHHLQKKLGVGITWCCCRLLTHQTSRNILASFACLSPRSHADSNTGVSSFLGPWYDSPTYKRDKHHPNLRCSCPVTGTTKQSFQLSSIHCMK